MKTLYFNRIFYENMSASGSDPASAYLIVLFVLIAAVIAVLALRGKTSPLSSLFEKPGSIEPSKPENIDGPPTVRLKGIRPYGSDPYESKGIVTFCKYTPRNNIWICPDCETENSTESRRCRSCGCLHL